MPNPMDVIHCPHCGSVDAPEVLTWGELSQQESASASSSFAVCCVVREGGCGATGGFAQTPMEAREKWNRRVRQ